VIALNATKYDVVVVGGGAAGLTASVYLARSRRQVVVIDAGEPRNAPSAHLHGFLSQDGTPPGDLLAAGRKEVAGYGGELIEGRVEGLDKHSEGGFTVRLAGGAALATRAVLVATGLRDILPDIPGLRERWGIDVLHCPYCHGYEVRDQPIGVIGGANRPFTLHQASLVRQWSADVVFFPNGITLTDEEREQLTARGIRVVEGEVARLSTEGDRLHGVTLAGGQTVERSAVFIGPRFVPLDELLTGAGSAVGENGWVTVDPTGRTSVPGLWGAGNVVDESAQAVKAAGSGAVTAIAINHYLLADDVERAVTAHRAAGEMLSATS
jgi:thioredoxin reductase (NADPH)